ncbi:MAG: T9SS type A sorting domain-containing protein [Saprospiraceae bacterium]
MKSILPILLCLPLGSLFSQASDQYIIAAQGGCSEGKSMVLSWTIGDLVTETANLKESTVTQGFQQPIISVKEINVANPVDVSANGAKTFENNVAPINPEAFQAEVYPNPFGTDITIKIENADQEYYMDIIDPAGNLLSRNKSRNPQEVINLLNLPAAQYLLRISSLDAKQSKVFQIIKSN